MFSQDFVLSILQEEKICKEEQTGGKGQPGTGPSWEAQAIVEFEKNYVVRLRNKGRLPCAVDLYVDGERVNELGQIVVFGNDYIDVPGFMKKDGSGKTFQFAKLKDSRIKQPNESQNGIIEAKFYLQEEKVKELLETHVHIHDWSYRPIWIIPYREPYYWPKPFWYPWNNPPYYTTGDNLPVFQSGGMSAGSFSDVKGTFADKSDVFCSGATVEGDNFQIGESLKERPKFNLSNIVTTLRMKLVGVEIKKLRCRMCEELIDQSWVFCPKCGNQLRGQ
jgi:hypothetical protein